MKTKISALVVSTRRVNEEHIMSTLTSEGRIIIVAHDYFKPGSYIGVSGTRKSKDIPELIAEHIRVLNVAEQRRASKEIKALISRECKLTGTKLFVDPVMKRLDKKFDTVAALILEAAFLNRPIILRYHNDTDGVCAALAIHLSIAGARNFKAIANRSPYYKFTDCRADIDRVSALDAEYLPPLLIILDFGSSAESVEAYKFAKQKGFEIIVIDHHPPVKELTKHCMLISPYIAGGGSDYVAGLLACEVAQRIRHFDLHDLHQIAIAGDRSRLSGIAITKEHEKIGLVLDFLAASSKSPQTMESFARVLTDRPFINVTYAQIRERIDAVRERLLKKMKQKEIGSIKVFLVLTDREFKAGEFPGRGEMASILYEAVAKDIKAPAIIIGHGKRSFNLRLNGAALDAGISCAYLIEMLKETIPDAIEAGGGHPGAAGIRVERDFARIVLDQLLKEIEKLKIKQ